MSYGPRSVFTISFASGQTLSSAITFERAWGDLHVGIPTMPSGTDIYFQGACDEDTSFKRFYHSPTIANANPGALYLNSAVTNCIVEMNQDLSCKYFKIELSTAMTASPATFKVVMHSH